MAKKSGSGTTVLGGLSRKNPPQMASGDPSTPKLSVDSDAMRSSTAKTPPTLGPRTA